MSDRVDKYTYRIEWSQEDEAYVARCLEFPSLAADGTAPELALREIKSVVAESVAWMEEEGEEVPEPLSLRECKG